MISVIICTIVDRCDFKRPLIKRAFEKRSIAEAWGTLKADRLREAHGDLDLFDPIAEIEEVLFEKF